MTVLERFAEYLTQLRLDALAEDEHTILGLHLLDTVGASVAGMRTADGQALCRFDPARRLGGRPTRDPLAATAVRVAVTRLTELDDIHMESCTTPGAVVIPTALTIAATRPDIDNAALGAAMLAGYEAMTRLGGAIGGAAIVYRGVWPTYFCAPFASAAVAGRLLALAPDRMAHALAIALSTATGGMGRPRGEPAARWLLAGNAARNGVLAALAAEDGFVGDLTLLDGGWLTVTHGIATDTQPLANANEATTLRSLSLKPWCAAKQAVAAIHAMRDIVNGGVAPDGIDAVRVFVPPAYAGMIGHQPAAGMRLSSISSAPWQLALAVCRPDGLYDAARAAAADDPAIMTLAARISVAADEALAVHWPARYPARVVATVRGSTHERLVLDAPGDPAMRLDRIAVLSKFDRVAGKGARATALRAAALDAFDAPEGIARLAAAYARLFAGKRRRSPA